MTDLTLMESLKTAFPNYLRLHDQLVEEYKRTPNWRWIRQATLNHRLHQLNQRYERWYSEWLKNSASQ